jgi:hypothetical protein
VNDSLWEDPEAFVVYLNRATDATIGGSGYGVATIYSDDYAPILQGLTAAPVSGSYISE